MHTIRQKRNGNSASRSRWTGNCSRRARWLRPRTMANWYNIHRNLPKTLCLSRFQHGGCLSDFHQTSTGLPPNSLPLFRWNFGGFLVGVRWMLSHHPPRRKPSKQRHSGQFWWMSDDFRETRRTSKQDTSCLHKYMYDHTKIFLSAFEGTFEPVCSKQRASYPYSLMQSSVTSSTCFRSRINMQNDESYTEWVSTMMESPPTLTGQISLIH